MNRSPLKWAGSKAGVMDQLIYFLPTGNRLVEPFVGSGTVFLNTDYKTYLLCDINPDLILFFIKVKNSMEKLLRYARELFTNGNTPEKFYEIRTAFNSGNYSSYQKAAMFLYLNRHCFNGLCRYSELSGFNVPFGKYKQPYFPDKELRLFSEKANDTGAVFLCCDFSECIEMAGDGDVIYADPPYVPISGSSSFTKYYSSEFGLPEHERLSNELSYAKTRGCRIVASNSEAAIKTKIYSQFECETIDANRSISRATGVDKTAKEAIFTTTNNI
ncbi:DNA adenine methylase [Acerihabitans arboris]|uniref:Site-specific DNA-methyltransferase (adenine-specific) n=1 Tax=Acerihabitans arboris TaxID=2691583 RepID=A0A845SI36_9GAMM|nr:Dam family site-specific DNA-(adenine-N6)-methyltransferase [Acerihabitans arboris]NDL64813.1 Dam family site-specific DNA-(adenine-N6)-methyltransferase [Acerihabitans arboris]